MNVEIGSMKVIKDFTLAEKAKITDDLSLLNPAYVSAKKFTSYSTISIPMYLTYYSQLRNALVVPRGYEIPFKYEVTGDTRFTLENVLYPRFLLKLRETQKEAEKAYLANREAGNGVIVLPTGKGKSILGLHLAKTLKQRVLIIVHKDDLVEGWKADAKLALGLRPKQVGIIKAKEFRIGKQITIATIQTLSKLPQEKLKELRDTFSMVIVDECHHVPAKTFEVVGYFSAKDKVGLTATDIRNDGLGNVIQFYLGKVCYRFKETNDDEDIIPANKVFVKIQNSNVKYNPPTQFSLPNRTVPIDSFYYNDKEWFIKELLLEENKDDLEYFLKEGVIFKKPTNFSKVMKAIWTNQEHLLQVARDIVSEFRKGRSSLVLCIEKEHCRAISNALIAYEVPSSTIQLYYGDATESKTIMKAKAESRECLITIATYAIAKEGTNVKAWERIFLAMTINNELDVIQAIGRGRRQLEGKTKLIVYDYRHNGVKGARNHGQTRDAVYTKLGFNIIGANVIPIQSSRYNIHRGYKRA